MNRTDADKAAARIIAAFPTMTVAERANYRRELYHLAVVEGSTVASEFLTR